MKLHTLKKSLEFLIVPDVFNMIGSWDLVPKNVVLRQVFLCNLRHSCLLWYSHLISHSYSYLYLIFISHIFFYHIHISYIHIWYISVSYLRWISRTLYLCISFIFTSSCCCVCFLLLLDPFLDPAHHVRLGKLLLSHLFVNPWCHRISWLSTIRIDVNEYWSSSLSFPVIDDFGWEIRPFIGVFQYHRAVEKVCLNFKGLPGSWYVCTLSICAIWHKVK